MLTKDSSNSFSCSPSKKFQIKEDCGYFKPYQKHLRMTNANPINKQHNRHSSIESIHLDGSVNRQALYCKDIMRNHSFINSQKFETEVDQIRKTQIKRKAYQFFDKFKQNQLASPKTNKYRLPKITKYKVVGASNRPKESLQKLKTIRRKQKLSEKQNSIVQNKVMEKIQQFRNRCNKQSQIDSFELNLDSYRKQYYFDVGAKDQDKIVYPQGLERFGATKFKLLENQGRDKTDKKHEINTGNQDNESLGRVPQFLMERLSVKQLPNSKVLNRSSSNVKIDNQRMPSLKKDEHLKRSPEKEYQLLR